MSLKEFIIGVVVALPLIYVVARFVTAAYFKSKQEHEQRKAR